jgi:hypothetical protein
MDRIWGFLRELIEVQQKISSWCIFALKSSAWIINQKEKDKKRMGEKKQKSTRLQQNDDRSRIWESRSLSFPHSRTLESVFLFDIR